VRGLGSKIGAEAAIAPDYKLLKTKGMSLPGNAELKAGVVANAGGFGFYRTAYPAAVAGSIAGKLDALNPAERLCFLSDHAALATAGKIPVEQYLNVLKSYRHETNFAVWNCIIDCFRKLDRFVQADSRAAFSKLINNVLKEEYERLGWESKPDESAPVRLVRGEVIRTLGTLGANSEVIAKARQILADYVNDANSANPDVLDAVTEVVAFNGNQKDFETIKSLWKKAGNPELEHRNLFALAAFRDKSVLQKALPLTLSKEVRSQDAPKLLYRFFESNDSKLDAWKFMKEHWPQIKKAYAPHMLSRLAEAPQDLCTQENYLDAKAFFTVNKIPDGTSDIARMLEKLKINVQFNQHSGKALNSWLTKNAEN
jgi:hypothetical protein